MEGSVLRPAVSATRARRGGAVGALALLALVAASSQAGAWTFLPPLSPSEVPAALSDARAQESGPWEWWGRAAAVDLALCERDVRRTVQNGIDGVSSFLEQLDDAAAAAGFATKPVPAMGAELARARWRPEAVPNVIEPLTNLYMKYKFVIKPRCKDCMLIRRWGRFYRVCHVFPKHKARQPGLAKGKHVINNIKHKLR
ncbi:unnamed protein product, partial [Prorocentrum cordatum]